MNTYYFIITEERSVIADNLASAAIAITQPNDHYDSRVLSVQFSDEIPYED